MKLGSTGDGVSPSPDSQRGVPGTWGEVAHREGPCRCGLLPNHTYHPQWRTLTSRKVAHSVFFFLIKLLV